MVKVKISVCIPAYKNAAFLHRCLDSLVSQSFKPVEVILSDDSPDNSVAEIAAAYKDRLHIIYRKNEPALGTPANWNCAMQLATGTYVKLMHDDDWLATDDALQRYYDCLEANPGVNFCFSAFNNVNLATGNSTAVHCAPGLRSMLKKDRYHLFKYNFIGPPSAVFQRNTGDISYDENLKWLVDFEGYTRFLGENNSFVYINEPLVNIGLGDEQVTTSTKNVKEVVVPESLYFLNKHGAQILKNIWVYDFYWRTFRNLSVKTGEEIRAAGWQGNIPVEITGMLQWQGKFPPALLKVGVLSKLLMAIGWLK